MPPSERYWNVEVEPASLRTELSMWQQIETVLAEHVAVRIVAATVIIEVAVISVVMLVRELVSLVA